MSRAAERPAAYGHNDLKKRVHGPDKPPVARIQTLFIRKRVIKIEQQASTRKVKKYLTEVQQAITADERFRTVNFYYDADPM